MRKALAMVELTTVSAGLLAADRMLKTAPVELLQAQPVCPGKYLVLAAGELSAVEASLRAVEAAQAGQILDQFLLGNPHEGLFPAICGAVEPPERGSLGVLESYTAASAIVAADAAAKSAQVTLLELRLARGLCGKSYVLLSGSIAAVEAAVQSGKKSLAESGLYLDAMVLPSPDPALWKAIL